MAYMIPEQNVNYFLFFNQEGKNIVKKIEEKRIFFPMLSLAKNFSEKKIK